MRGTTRRLPSRICALVCAFALVVAACSGDDSPATTDAVASSDATAQQAESVTETSLAEQEPAWNHHGPSCWRRRADHFNRRTSHRVSVGEFGKHLVRQLTRTDAAHCRRERHRHGRIRCCVRPSGSDCPTPRRHRFGRVRRRNRGGRQRPRTHSRHRGRSGPRHTGCRAEHRRRRRPRRGRPAGTGHRRILLWPRRWRTVSAWVN